MANCQQANNTRMIMKAVKPRTGVRRKNWLAAPVMVVLGLAANNNLGAAADDDGATPQDLGDGLVGHWTFDEGEGSVAHDFSGGGSHGTIKGGARWTEGRIGGALEFDGADDFVSIPNESQFDITGNVTVAAWVRVESFQKSWQAIVTKGDRAWRLHRANETRSVGFACSDLSRGQVGDLYGNKDVDDGKWHHVAGVLDGRTASIFVDAVLDASAESSPQISVNDFAVLIGANAQVAGRLFHGLIDDVRIYDRALSIGELRELAEGGGAVAPVLSNPVGGKPATPRVEPAESFAADGFRRIFNGKTVAGWSALDMSYWSIKDGAITGQSTRANPCTSNQFMVWQGGDVADFELKLRFRVSGNGCNSGIQFRSEIRPDGLAVGYQADIYQSGDYLGGVCDELHRRKGPELLTANGKKTVIDESGKRTATDLGGKAVMKPGEWNEYHIVAKGQQIILSINGIKCSELIDQEAGHFDLKGILGLQLRSGKPMIVQFKDIYLKQLEARLKPDAR